MGSARSLIYRSRFLYEGVMRVLYGFHYADRFKCIANLIPSGCSVLDLCCGPATVYFRELESKNIRYHGVDCSEDWVSWLKKKRVSAQLLDLDSCTGDLPVRADVLLMQASLYHFLPDNAERMIYQMLKAAHNNVIITEPIKNIASSDYKFMRWLGVKLTKSGTQSSALRFDEAKLDALMLNFKDKVEQVGYLPGRREKYFVLKA